jgi:hypothetical protein
MSYIDRFLKFSDSSPGPTDRNDKNPPQESGDSYEDPLTETTKTHSVVSVSDQGEESTDFASPLPPWTPRPRELASWPVAWRQRWGLLANTLQDQGIPWPEHERQAFDLVKAEMEAS